MTSKISQFLEELNFTNADKNTNEIPKNDNTESNESYFSLTPTIKKKAE